MTEHRLPVEGAVRRRGAAVSWVLLVVVESAMGAAAWFPLVFAWLLGRAVAGELGWVPVDPTLLDDGWFVLVFATVVLWSVFLAIALPVTWAVHRGSSIPSRLWWRVSVLLWVAPFGLVVLRGHLQ